MKIITFFHKLSFGYLNTIETRNVGSFLQMH